MLKKVTSSSPRKQPRGLTDSHYHHHNETRVSTHQEAPFSVSRSTQISGRIQDVTDALARIQCLRGSDIQQMDPLSKRSSSSSSSMSSSSLEMLSKVQRRELWRQAREDEHFEKLAMLLSQYQTEASEQQSSPRQGGGVPLAVTEAVMDGTAVAHGLSPNSFSHSAFRHFVPADVLDVKGGKYDGGLFMIREKKKSTTGGQPTGVDVMGDVYTISSSTSSAQCDRSVLQQARSDWTSMSLLWQKWSTTGGRHPFNFGIVAQKRVDMQRQEFQLVFKRLQQQGGLSSTGTDKRSSLADSERHSSLSSPPPPPPPLSDTSPSPGRHQVADQLRGSWTTKWSSNNHVRLVGIMQACLRGRWVRATVAGSAERARKASCTNRLMTISHTLQRHFRTDIPHLQKYVEMVNFIAEEEMRLEMYYDTEEDHFQKQWNRYVKQMTHYFTTDCAIDSHWAIQKGCDPQKPIFVNVQTGKTQQEHPNTLKMIAAKNRQWMHACKEREKRQMEARRAVQELNRLKKEELPLLEGELSIPIFS